MLVGTFFFYKPVLCSKAFLGQGAVAGRGEGGFAFFNYPFFFFNDFHQKEYLYGAALGIHPLCMSGFGGLFLKKNLMPVFNCHVFLLT